MISLLETMRSQPRLLSPCVWLAPRVSIFPKRFILSDSPTKILYACLLNTEHSTCPTRGVLDLTLILRRSRTGTVWFYTSTSNKRAARPKLYTKSLTRDLKRLYSRLTLMRISIKL